MSAKRSQHGKAQQATSQFEPSRVPARTAAGLPLLLAAACAPAATPSTAPAAAKPAAAATIAPKAAATAAPPAQFEGGRHSAHCADCGASHLQPGTAVGVVAVGGLIRQLAALHAHARRVRPPGRVVRVIEDGKAIDLKLRKGVKFASARSSTADDIDWMIS